MNDYDKVIKMSDTNQEISSKAIDRYLEIESMLHAFFDNLGYCKENFNRKCQGCCGRDVIELSLHKDSCYKLDEERLKIYGRGNPDSGCPYSSKAGCVLETHKHPTCISYVCNQLTEHLKDRGLEYDWFKTQSLLLDVLNDVSNTGLDEDGLPTPGMSDEEFFAVRMAIENSLNPKLISESKP